MTATVEPLSFTAGDTVAWQRTLDDYPASVWTLQYTLINSTAKYTVNASAAGDVHEVTIAAATSANYTPGTYTWMATVTYSGTRHTIGTGTVTVARNLAAATTYDTRTSARKALDAMDALLETYGSKAYLQEYDINGRRQKFQTPGDFLAFREKLRAEVRREENAERIAAGLAPHNQISVRFNTR